jgi:hypothetical protein
MRWIGQAIVYAGMAVWLGYFANMPVYVHLPPDKALIKLSVIHGGEHKGGCRERTAGELAELPPNMRNPLDCPRERLPVHIEILLDGTTIYSETLAPAGLARGGQSRAYERFTTDPGEHLLVARLIDSARAEGYDFERSARIALEPGENFVIDFRPELGGFLFRGRSVANTPES